MLEATRSENVLDIVMCSQKKYVGNIKICETLGCSDHNQIHFIIKVKGERNRKIRYRKHFHEGRYKDMKIYLAKIDWNSTLKKRIRQQQNAGISYRVKLIASSIHLSP